VCVYARNDDVFDELDLISRVTFTDLEGSELDIGKL
jgi:hypothetical protein